MREVPAVSARSGGPTPLAKAARGRSRRARAARPRWPAMVLPGPGLVTGKSSSRETTGQVLWVTRKGREGMPPGSLAVERAGREQLPRRWPRHPLGPGSLAAPDAGPSRLAGAGSVLPPRGRSGFVRSEPGYGSRRFSAGCLGQWASAEGVCCRLGRNHAGAGARGSDGPQTPIPPPLVRQHDPRAVRPPRGHGGHHAAEGETCCRPPVLAPSRGPAPSSRRGSPPARHGATRVLPIGSPRCPAWSRRSARSVRTPGWGRQRPSHTSPRGLEGTERWGGNRLPFRVGHRD